MRVKFIVCLLKPESACIYDLSFLVLKKFKYSYKHIQWVLIIEWFSYSSSSNSRTKRDAKTPVEIERRVYGLMERFTSRAKLFEILPNPKGLTNGTHYDNLSCSIWGLYSVKAQTSETYVRKLQLWQSVYLTIRVRNILLSVIPYIN